MSEVVLWNEVARRGYKLRWFNDIIYFCDYLEDGLTKNSEKILFNNPVAHQMMTKELLQIDFTLKRKFGMIYNYHKIRNQNKKFTQNHRKLRKCQNDTSKKIKEMSK